VVLQAAILLHGGLTTIGVNAFTMGAGALSAGWLFARRPSAAAPAGAARWGAAAGGAGALVSLGLYAGALLASGNALGDVARFAVLANLPVVALEALVAGAAVGFVARVEPGLLLRSARAGAAALAMVAAVCATPQAALAHGVHVEARVEGRELVVEGQFSDNTPLEGGRVEVEARAAKGSSGSVWQLEGRLDVRGTWRTELPIGARRLRVVVEDAAGHRSETHLQLGLDAADRRASSRGGAAHQHDERDRHDMILRVAMGLAAIVGLALVLHAVQRRRATRGKATAARGWQGDAPGDGGEAT
jgi:hypothetical protein